jgi:hypothetical protein
MGLDCAFNQLRQQRQFINALDRDSLASHRRAWLLVLLTFPGHCGINLRQVGSSKGVRSDLQSTEYRVWVNLTGSSDPCLV